MISPVFSIITVTYNAGLTLEKTIQSVLAQENSLLEYIIIDGGSTDDTINCIKKYQENLKYWISEKDDGIYDAMNKALDKSQGKWVLFLGGNDRLNIDVLKKVYKHLDDSKDLIYGNIVFNTGRRYKSILNLKTILNNTVHHQGAFYNKKLFDNFRYDTTIKTMADYELNLLIYLSRKQSKKINIDIAECDANGVSSEIGRSLEELQLIHTKHYSPFLRKILSKIVKLKYFIHYKH
ncbi:glycosyltransferase [Spirosoma sp. HMF4905]|uniref:Glycosyltransferase n=1 Tax=Spirosoma arboris TaxID=2682092 RepID=A0A7K1S6U2_9BACT|nr:glycosyltransferase family 2 protein [Spirosoma arboris]MVM29561.1 glycosyltransferase [Spirosoma arboris]